MFKSCLNMDLFRPSLYIILLCDISPAFRYSGIPIFLISKGNENWFEKSEFEKSGVKLQCSTEEGKQLLVRVIGRFETMRVREIGIPLDINFHVFP